MILRGTYDSDGRLPPAEQARRERARTPPVDERRLPEDGFRCRLDRRLELAGRSGAVDGVWIARDRQCAAVVAGRIDNRAELGEALDAPAGAGPAGLLLRGYHRWGSGVAERLCGDFVVLVWDARARTLFCARDPMGVVSLWYRRERRRLDFSTQFSSLPGGTPGPATLDEQAAALYVGGCFDDRSRTLFRTVRRLPPGHRLELSVTGLRIARYWTPRPVRLPRPGDYVDAFRERFDEAVRCRLPEGTRVGCMLSGGLDSSSVAVSAARHAQPVTCTLYSRDPGVCDERAYAEAVARRIGSVHDEVAVDALSPLCKARQLLSSVGRPYFPHGLSHTGALYDKLLEHECRVVLDGFDGDAVLSHGSGVLADWVRTGHLLRAGTQSLLMAHRHRRLLGTIVRSRVVVPLLPPAVRRIRRERELAAHPQLTLLRPAPRREVARRLLLGTATAEQREPPADAQHLASIESGTIAEGLETYRALSAQRDLSHRFPFFDRRIVELALGTPPELKLNGGITRVLLRRAMAPFLPVAVVERPGKMNFAPLFVRYMYRQDRATLERCLTEPTERLRSVVDFARARAALATVANQRNARVQGALCRLALLCIWTKTC